MIEGANLTVCGKCAKHGTIIREEPKPIGLVPKPQTRLQPLTIRTKKSSETTLDTSIELIENFAQKIRQAREKLGLSHEELGKKTNEKVSLLKKIETGKMTPDNKLSAKLEYALKIKLLAPATEEKVPKTKISKPASRELTLGDLIQLNKKEKEEPTERKPS
jgi:putative transcription factor